MREAGAPQGLAWSWELDFDALQAALDGPAPWNRPRTSRPAADGDSAAADSTAADSTAADSTVADSAEEEDQEALLDAMLASERAPEIPIGTVAGRIAESLPTGPGLAAWLASAGAGDSEVGAGNLEEGALAGVAASFRRMASWAQAGELAAVAQIASRAAARDEKIGVDDKGRPARIPASACSEVSLGLVMTQLGASWWTDLAVTLRWRLPATGAALAEGSIDLPRARLLAEATSLLGDEAARDVEEQVLSGAGRMTTGQLRAALRRAVIAVDPEGAERRREEAERRAKVSLYGDEDGTATLSGSGLPVIQAAAAMARVTAMARALKASGASGGMDLHRAQVFIGLLLGTLPYIPPAEGGPPDIPPPADDSGPDGGGPDDGSPYDDDPDAAGLCPGDQDAPWDDGDPYEGGDPILASHDEQDMDDLPATPPAWAPLPAAIPPAFARSGTAQAGSARSGTAQAGTGRPPPGLLDLSLPWSVLVGLSAEPGHLGRIGPIAASQARRLADAASADPAAEWRIIVTTRAGQALAVARIPRPRVRGESAGHDGPAAGAGLVGRITLTISEDALTSPPGRDPPGGIAAAALRTANRAAARAKEQARGNAAAGGCAHQAESLAYRPPPRLLEFVIARDLTCRFPSCRQPAWRGDLDHTIPHDRGGRTCSCNLGPLCRSHHQIKQLRGWLLSQPSPGIFEWLTPTGRRYAATPDIHPV
jgi:uncharacterized protein DUF222